METKKFEFISADTLMPVLVSYKEDGRVSNTIAFADYGRDMVYFPFVAIDPNEEGDSLRRDILASIDKNVPLNEQPTLISKEINEMIENMRSGHHGYNTEVDGIRRNNGNQ